MPKKKRSSPPKIEKKEELDDERNIPFKKRRVRLGKDGDFHRNSPITAERDSPNPSLSSPQQGISPRSAKKTKAGKPSFSKHQEEAEVDPPQKLNFEIIISKEDQQKAQNLWCEYHWKKTFPGQPIRILKYVELERVDHPMTYYPEDMVVKKPVKKRVRFA